MDSIVNTINNLISISDFNKGEAGKIFSSVKSTNQPKIVLRRNEPECVLLSPKSYADLMNELEDLRDYKLAVERMASSSKTIPWEEVLKELNISQSEIDEMEDVEFE